MVGKTAVSLAHQSKQSIMTPFQQAVLQVELAAGKLQTPSVSYSGKAVDYFKYQLAVHKFNLSIMSKGMTCRGVKLKDLKHYYGLTGRSAADCLPQFIQLMDNFLNSGKNN